MYEQARAFEMLLSGEIDVNGYVDEKGIRYIGKAQRKDGQWVCLADVGGALCWVEVNLSITTKELHVEHLAG